MKYVIRTFFLSLKRVFSSPRSLIASALLPLIAAAFVVFVPASELSSPVQVGVVLECEEDFMSLFDSYNDGIVNFIITDKDTMERKVSTSRWDCGIIIPSDFAERIRSNETDRLVTLVKGPGSAAYPIVREIVSTCIARLLAPVLADDYLSSIGIAHAANTTGAERVDVIVTTADGNNTDVFSLSNGLWNDFLMAVLGGAASIYMLLTATDLGRKLNSKPGQMLYRLRPLSLTLLPQVFAALCPMLLASFISALILSDLSVFTSIAALILFLGAIAMLLSRLPKVWSSLPVFVPFVPIAAFLCVFRPFPVLLLPLSLLFFLFSFFADRVKKA